MKELSYKAEIGNIARATEAVQEWLEEHGCSSGIQIKIAVALDEVLSNIARYAYPKRDGSFTVRMDYDSLNKMAVMSFVDSGVPFNPLERKEPDVTLSIEDRPIGGLGIFLVRKMMDGVKYERKDGKNILTLYKKIV